MLKNKKIAVIIAAAGSGNRMGSGIPKQFIKIKDKTILQRAVEAFEKNESIDSVYVVVNEKYKDLCKKIISNETGFFKIKEIVSGGKERQDSIYEALRIIPDDIDYVLVHDGARPFVSQNIINNLIESMIVNGAAAVAVPVKDTIKKVEGDVFSETLKRQVLYSVQTPQGFSRQLLNSAYKMAFNEKYYGTDDAVLVEKYGEKVYLVEGEYQNIKITTKEDLAMGEVIVKDESQDYLEKTLRVGTGYDVHRLVEGRKLILGGVDIPFEKGLLGHSDADVLIHAIMDALLGAAGLGDIGRHFPDSDEKYCGISSMALMKEVKSLLEKGGYSIENIDATVIAQRPKILPHIEKMINNIAGALNINKKQINIKGTTTEGLGFCGREEGIASQASVLIKKENHI